MIENVLFDIGGVLLHLHYEPALARLLPLCNPLKVLNPATIFSMAQGDPHLVEYERGNLSTEAFYRHFQDISGYRGTLQDFTEAWHPILSENRPMLDFATSLAERYNVYLASNCGELVLGWMFDRFPDLKRARDVAISCRIRAVKPDREFYELATAKFGVTAHSCLFVDDRAENVEAARDFGMSALRYTTAAETIRAIETALSRDGRKRE